MRDLHRHLPADIGQDELGALIDDLSADPEVTGILLQLPLPPHLDAAALLARIDPDKDVDGLAEAGAGRLALGKPGLRPCTPSGVMLLLDRAGVQLEGAEAVVVGRSTLVGKPQAQLLLERNATVTVCHSRTRDLASVCRRADIVVAAAGCPGCSGRTRSSRARRSSTWASTAPPMACAGTSTPTPCAPSPARSLPSLVASAR